MSRPHRLPRLRRILPSASLLVIALCLTVGGCGKATYERRLEQTIAYAEYQETLNENLAPTWSSKGVELRVPRQFRRLPAPKPPEDEEGDNPPDELPVDQRQPDYMTTELPGLIGAWEAQVELANGDGTAPAYLYVLSNYDLWDSGADGEEALEFNAIAAAAVVDGLRAKHPEPAEWRTETHPDGESFVSPNHLTAALVKSTVTFHTASPDDAADDGTGVDDADGVDDAAADDRFSGPSSFPEAVPPPAAGTPVNCKIYLAEEKDIRVVIVLVVPEQISAAEELSLTGSNDARVALALETLVISGEKPSRRDGDGGGGESGRGGF